MCFILGVLYVSIFQRCMEIWLNYVLFTEDLGHDNILQTVLRFEACCSETCVPCLGFLPRVLISVHYFVILGLVCNACRNVHVTDLLSWMIDLHVKVRNLGPRWLAEIYNMVRLVGLCLVMLISLSTLGAMCRSIGS